MISISTSHQHLTSFKNGIYLTIFKIKCFSDNFGHENTILTLIPLPAPQFLTCLPMSNSQPLIINTFSHAYIHTLSISYMYIGLGVIT